MVKLLLSMFSSLPKSLIIEKSREPVSAGISKVNVPVQDRVMLHLFENDDQADRYLVGPELTTSDVQVMAAWGMHAAHESLFVPAWRMDAGCTDLRVS